MLTEKQHNLLTYLYEQHQDQGICPSYEDMRHALGLKSKSGAHALVKALVERGYCRRLPNRARAIEVIKLPNQILQKMVGDNVQLAGTVGDVLGIDPRARNSGISIPLYGGIAAGLPIEAFQNEEEWIKVPPELLGPEGAVHPEQFFALRIIGDSMKEAGILDQDTVILKKCSDAPQGSIVAALVDEEEVTLKRFETVEGKIVLEPANKDFIAQILDPHRVKIQGLLVNLIRKYS